MKKVIALLLIPFFTFASEGDAFSARLYEYQDMNKELSREVNIRLQKALDKANKENHDCESIIALKAVEKAFLRPVVGVFEFWSSHSSKVKGHYIKYQDSIYKDLSITENLPVHLGKLGMATFFKINGTLVASDKFGHFFDEGHTYFKMVNQEGKSLVEAMEHGIALEKGSYGLKRSKVFSYGDLVANRNGYEFWNSLFNDTNGNNIIKCENGVFKISRLFNFADYVDSAWDESINCSTYSDASVESRVNLAIQQIETKANMKLSCPVERDKCLSIANTKYSNEKEYLISPKCN